MTRAEFMERVSGRQDACWEWAGWRCSDGRYGEVKYQGRRWAAHRLAYEIFVGPIPPGYHVHHRCRNTLCVNPAHLSAVTPAEHLQLGPTIQALNAAKTHCKRGHEFTPENTYAWRHRGRRHRSCRTCRRQRTIEWNARRALGSVAQKEEETDGAG